MPQISKPLAKTPESKLALTMPDDLQPFNPPMSIVAVGVDLAKNVFAVHGIDEKGKVVLLKPKVKRADLLPLWRCTAVPVNALLLD